LRNKLWTESNIQAKIFRLGILIESQLQDLIDVVANHEMAFIGKSGQVGTNGVQEICNLIKKDS